MDKLTKTQQLALNALIRHGGEGIMTKTGTMLARGAELGHGDDGEGSREEGWEIDFFQRSTWKALADLDRIEEVAPKRWRVKSAPCGHCGKSATTTLCGVGGCPLGADL